MPTQCYTPFQAQAIRATRLDACGVPVIGTKSTLVSDGVISVELKGQTDSGTDVEVKNAKGQIKLSAPGCPTLKYIDATVTMVDVDPDLFELWTNQQLVTDSRGNVVGIREDEYIPCNHGVALETWTLSGSDAGQCITGGQDYGYFLAPYIVNGMIGDVTLNDGAMSCVLTGRTKRGSGWGLGPYNVMDSAVSGAVTPGKLLVAIGPKTHKLMMRTPVPPPAAACGAIPLAA